MTDLQYPIGKYEEQPYSAHQQQRWLNDIRFLPDELAIAVQNLDQWQLETPYRSGGWTVQQVVHHIADSHMNAWIRFRLALTEERPSIKPYDEKAWANLPDVQQVPINVSITLVYALHQRMHALLSGLTDTQWQRQVFHPEHQQYMTVWYLLGNYAWHGKHHVAHITSLRERHNW